MPSATLTSIQLAVFDHVKAAAGLLPIKKQGKKFDHNDQPYAALIISPMDTESETIDGGDRVRGFILFNIYTPKNYGANWAAAEGEKLIALFPRDSKLGPIRIDGTGSIRALYDNRKGWDITPTLVKYEAI